MSNFKILPSLEKLRSLMVITSLEIRLLKDKETHQHADQLKGAADIVQGWIDNIRNGK